MVLVVTVRWYKTLLSKRNIRQLKGFARLTPLFHTSEFHLFVSITINSTELTCCTLTSD